MGSSRLSSYLHLLPPSLQGHPWIPHQVNQALCAEFDPTEVPKDRNAARVGGNWKAGRQPEKN